MLTILQQFAKAIDDAKSVLIVAANNSGDTIASTTALATTLEKLGKQVLALNLAGVPDNLRFLSGTEKIRSQLSVSKDFIVSLNLAKGEVEQLSYKIENGKLNILITPRGEAKFEPKDVSFERIQENFDLIVTINTRDLEKFQALFTNNTKLFYNSLVVNIDHDPANESFGKINLIDVHAASTTQILFALFDHWKKEGRDLLDKQTATALLTGIIAETESFQTYSVTPEVFRIASSLALLGADQQEIIRYLFKTKSLAALNLWGRVLASLKQDATKRIAWSTLLQKDFDESKAEPKDLESALKELLASVPGAEILFTLYQHKGKVLGKIHAPKIHNALEFAQMFPRATGNSEMARFEILRAPSIEAAEQLVIENISRKLA